MFGFYNDKFEVYYITKKRKLHKRKGFHSANDFQVWCKRQKGKIIIHSGSWQVLEYFDSL